jgi:hypothetical protein
MHDVYLIYITIVFKNGWVCSRPTQTQVAWLETRDVEGTNMNSNPEERGVNWLTTGWTEGLFSTGDIDVSPITQER